MNCPQDIVIEGSAVIWAEQAPRRSVPEGVVEQRLVALALIHLGGDSARPYRFANATGGTIGAPVLV